MSIAQKRLFSDSIARSDTERFRGSVLLLILSSCLMSVPDLHAGSPPVCPSNAESPYPSFGELDGPPNFASWLNIERLPEDCHISPATPAVLTVALAGIFTHTGPLDEIAARLGAITQTKGLPYWSVTDDDWRTLVTDAFALKSQDSSDVRADFTGQEILAGQPVYFAQNDTRSWGLNIYRARAIESSADHLAFESDNVSPIRLGPVTLFEPDDLRSVVFIDRLNDTTWTYYSLSVISHGTLAAREKSLVNRQAAFYRFLVRQAPDAEPPVAP